jgi:hypothetical protein
MLDFRSEEPFEIRAGSIAIPAQLLALDRARPGGAILVAVSGAGRFTRDTDASSKFPGRSAAARLGLPLLTFADARIAEGADKGTEILRIASGTGMDVPAAIAASIGHVARETGLRPIFIGPSGSGFILLNALRHMDCPIAGLVWNPPTGIDDKLAAQMGRFLARRRGLPDEGEDTAFAPLGRQLLKGIGIRESLSAADTGDARIVYLQNSGDSFVNRALGPFMDGQAWKRLSPRGFLCGAGRVGIFVGRWGRGHERPPEAMADRVLAALAAGDPPAAILSALDADEPPSEAVPFFGTDLPSAEPLSLKVRREGGRIRVRVRRKDGVPLPPARAVFTLWREDLRSKRPLVPHLTADFDDPGGENLRVRVVLRDVTPSARIVLSARVPRPAADPPAPGTPET